MMGWLVYILRGAGSGRLYTGITNNMALRLARHNAGKGAKATRAGGPWEVVWTEPAESRSAASVREAQIKRLSRKEKLDLIGRPGRTSTC